MSKLARKGVIVPDGFACAICEGGLQLTSASGTHIFKYDNSLLECSIHNTVVNFNFTNSLTSVPPKLRGMLGTTFACFKSFVSDTSKGYSMPVLLSGVGYKAAVVGIILSLGLGYSHSIKIAIPSDIVVRIDKGDKGAFVVVVSGKNRSLVMEFCHAIRAFRKPEPYKGKGLFIGGETILRKTGKKK